MSKLDSVMLTALPEGTTIRVEVTRRGESLELCAEMVARRTINGTPGESRHLLHAEAGPPKQVVSSMSRWIGENLAEIHTKRTP